MSTSTYVLKPRPAVRAFASAAVAALLGAGLTVLGAQNSWLVLVILGVALLVAAVALIGLALVARQRMRVHVTLDEEGYAVRGPHRVHEGQWREVTKVTQAPGRLTFHAEPGQGFVLIDPAGSSEVLDAVASDAAARLDADRGYRPFV